MSDITTEHLKKWFPNSRRIIGSRSREILFSALGEPDPEAALYNCLDALSKNRGLPDYLPEIAVLELKRYELAQQPETVIQEVGKIMINPELLLLPVSWKNLPGLLNSDDPEQKKPEPGAAHILLWRMPDTVKIQCRQATDDDLLALKLVAEDIDFREAAEQGNTTLAKVLAIFYHAVDSGILIAPATGIKRNSRLFNHHSLDKTFLCSDVFTLQWHITQHCDLHCRHCYDRTDRRPMPFEEAEEILDDFFDFTQAMNIRGQVTFTGGNPLLYPQFSNLYETASSRGFSLAILGNPAPSAVINTLQQIQPMTHFQISLEGLESYNDYIRGKGHFKKSIAFLEMLKEKKIYTMVMLTLNKENMSQVLPLAEFLKGKANSFTFNRLAMVGEGRNLSLPKADEYEKFLTDYVAAAESNPVISLKDNLINIVKQRAGQDLFGGCTGHGCGAAFNFFSLLADGEVHACRKFPSLIGNIRESSLLDIYTSPEAKAYRRGSSACRDCTLFAVCRGCPAVVYGMGLNWREDKDPFCFIG